MCALRAHIKLSIFRNIFSGIEKAAITFSILENTQGFNVCVVLNFLSLNLEIESMEVERTKPIFL